jgi:hypothetical protein
MVRLTFENTLNLHAVWHNPSSFLSSPEQNAQLPDDIANAESSSSAAKSKTAIGASFADQKRDHNRAPCRNA